MSLTLTHHTFGPISKIGTCSDIETTKKIDPYASLKASITIVTSYMIGGHLLGADQTIRQD